MSKATTQEHPTLISLDPLKLATEQQGLHNSPDIPAVVKVKPGEAFKIECLECSGGLVSNSDDADELVSIDFTGMHPLSGPIAVEGAEPGDCLVVDILDVQPFPQMQWGYTAIMESNAGGLLAKEFDSHAVKAIWDFEGIYASSRHVPGVRFAGVTHPGIIGTAPSAELLAKWNKREGELIASAPDAIPSLAQPPEIKGAYVGQKDLSDEVKERIAREGARTIPGREQGGNCDIKNLSRGSRVYLPVFVKDALLSVGDLHFSQGDGEMTFCGAIEMSGILTLKIHSLIKGGVDKFGMTMPMFRPSPIDPVYNDQLIFEGISVDLHGYDNGRQYDLDATAAYKQAALNAIAYLQKLGYTREQAYILLTAAPIESRIAALVDKPNALVTLGVPLRIFDFDILPQADGLKSVDRGQAAIRSDGVV